VASNPCAKKKAQRLFDGCVQGIPYAKPPSRYKSGIDEWADSLTRNGLELSIPCLSKRDSPLANSADLCANFSGIAFKW
jgi:hypothetical protein